jgi:hypothetical protein
MCWVRSLLLSDGSLKNIWPHCQTAVSELATVLGLPDDELMAELTATPRIDPGP